MKYKSILTAAITLALLISTTATAQQTTQESKMADKEVGFTSLFDGLTLEGWEQKNGTAKYVVSDGTILGTTAVGSPNSFLCSEKEYENFDLRFEVKVDKGLNSGVQIRSVSKPDFKKGRVHGPQIEIESDPGESGYVYSEGTGRGWISPTQTQKDVFKNDGWNKYRVLADGDRIQTWINGTQVEDLDVPEVESKKGFFGLQVHSVPKDKSFKVQWRNIRVKELDGTERRTHMAIHGTPEIDGKIDEAWNKIPRIVTSRSVIEHDDLSGDQKPAVASVKCMWDDGHLYCLAIVKDAKVSTSSDDPWEKDSVEFFVDGNMAFAESYDDDDAQYRTDADGGMTVGESSDETKYKSAVTKTEDGYIVEACIELDTMAGLKIGFDVQVNNDAGDGRRQSTMKWNDPTNNSFESMAGIGVLEFAPAEKAKK